MHILKFRKIDFDSHMLLAHKVVEVLTSSRDCVCTLQFIKLINIVNKVFCFRGFPDYFL